MSWTGNCLSIKYALIYNIALMANIYGLHITFFYSQTSLKNLCHLTDFIYLPFKHIHVLTKGQIILEQNCGVLNFQKSNEIIVRISSLAYEMGQIKKIKALYHIKWYIIINLHDSAFIFLI